MKKLQTILLLLAALLTPLALQATHNRAGEILDENQRSEY